MNVEVKLINEINYFRFIKVLWSAKHSKENPAHWTFRAIVGEKVEACQLVSQQETNK